MGLKQICLAVSLPLIAFLSLYWLRQRKKIDKKQDPTEVASVQQTASIKVKSTVEPINRSIDESTTESDYKSVDESIAIHRSVNNESTRLNLTTTTDRPEQFDEQTNRSSTNLSTNHSSANNSSTNLTNPLSSELHSGDRVNLNNNDDDFKSKLEQQLNGGLDSISTPTVLANAFGEPLDKSIPKETVGQQISVQAKSNDLTDHSVQQDAEHQVLTQESLSQDNDISTQEASIEEKSNEEASTQEKSTEQELVQEKSIEKRSIGQLDSALDKSTNDESTRLNESAIVLDVNEKSSLGDLQQSANSQSLVEGEEAIEFNLQTTTNDSPSLNSERFAEQFTNSLTFESNDNTFNTANDSSLNATVNTTIGSLDDTTLDSANCSTKTLRSLPNDSYDANCSKEETVNGVKSNESASDDVEASGVETNNVSEEEVKEDYKSEDKVNLDSSSTNSTSKVDLDEVNFKHLNEQNSSPLNSTINANSSSTTTDDIAENDEKFLNVTEHEFKNDSKIEIINAVVEEIKNKVSEESEANAEKETVQNGDKSADSLDNLDCSIKSEKDDSLNKSEEVGLNWYL